MKLLEPIVYKWGGDPAFALKSHTLYLVCGPQGVGKSTFIRESLNPPIVNQRVYGLWDSDAVLNVDDIAANLINPLQTLTPFGLKETYLPDSAKILGDFVYKLTEARLAQRLTTVVDMVMSTDDQRERFAGLAREHGMECCVLILTDDPVAILRRAARRVRHVPLDTVKMSIDKLQLTSKHPHHVIDLRDTSKPPKFMGLFHDKYSLPMTGTLDFISDVHGLYEPLLALLDKMGYEITAEGVPKHPDGNVLIFMGDIVDRGPDSLKVLDFVRVACQKGGHRMVMGNHEHKLLKYMQSALQGTIVDVGSRATMETGGLTRTKSEEWQKQTVAFLNQLPGYLIGCTATLHDTDKAPGYLEGRNVWVQHSDCVVKVNPLNHPLYHCLGGKGLKDTDWDTDTEWSQLNPGWTLIRGHIMPTSPAPLPNVKVVFNEGEYGGTLVGYRLPRVDEKLEYAPYLTAQFAFDKAETFHQETLFDYATVRASKPVLAQQLDALVRQNLVYKVYDAKEGLQLYRYQARVHYDKLWLKDKPEKVDPSCSSVVGNPLSEARGTVLNMMGDIVVRPFYKVLNAGEYGMALKKGAAGEAVPNFDNSWDEDLEVQVVDKLNGFAVFATLHPVRHEVLLSCTGSLGKDAPFVRMVRQWMEKSRTYGKYLVLCQEMRDYTLAFEMISPEDPHICSYAEHEQGLYLVGARHTATGEVVSETELDAWWTAAGKPGHRAAHWVGTIADVRKMAATVVNKEGVMVRCLATGQLLLKWKFNWYLTKKFFERLPASKITHMFKNTANFKQLVDEEFYGLVDMLVSTYTLDEFKALSPEERIRVVSTAFHA